MMSERVGGDAWKWMLTSAAEETRRRCNRRLGTDHLLLGLLHDGHSRTAKALGVPLADARAALDALDVAALAAVGVEIPAFDEGPVVRPGRGLPPLTSGAREVLQRAANETPAKRRLLDSSHVLLALLSLQLPDPAAELLEALGVDRAAVRRSLAGPAEGEVMA
ncbi:MAG: hypothetical protein JXA67_10445 [Micromonosporaceae bacterium]|nr:hypothetical protein [Micromonosporaceae bacterium]